MRPAMRLNGMPHFRQGRQLLPTHCGALFSNPSRGDEEDCLQLMARKARRCQFKIGTMSVVETDAGSIMPQFSSIDKRAHQREVLVKLGALRGILVGAEAPRQFMICKQRIREREACIGGRGTIPDLSSLRH